MMIVASYYIAYVSAFYALTLLFFDDVAFPFFHLTSLLNKHTRHCR